MASQPDRSVEHDAVSEPDEASAPRSRLGFALLVLGLLAIIVGVLYILEAANGPGTGPKAFAERRSYDQVKVAIHHAFPVGFAISMAGLGLALYGKRLMTRARP